MVSNGEPLDLEAIKARYGDRSELHPAEDPDADVTALIVEVERLRVDHERIAKAVNATRDATVENARRELEEFWPLFEEANRLANAPAELSPAGAALERAGVLASYLGSMLALLDSHSTDTASLLVDAQHLRSELAREAELVETNQHALSEALAEVESLRRQVAGTGSSWLDSVNAYVWRTPNGEQHTLHPSEVDIILPPDIADRLAAERDVIEAAKALIALEKRRTDPSIRADDWVPLWEAARLAAITAVDALSQPVAEEASGGS